MLKVYVAGAYSADNVLGVFENMRRGIKLSIQVRKAGFAPYSPWMDFQYYLSQDATNRFTIENCYEYSMEWLRVCDAVLLVPGWEGSKGVSEEIDVARELDIPVFGHLAGLIEWAENPNGLADGKRPSHAR